MRPVLKVVLRYDRLGAAGYIILAVMHILILIGMPLVQKIVFFGYFLLPGLIGQARYVGQEQLTTFLGLVYLGGALSTYIVLLSGTSLFHGLGTLLVSGAWIAIGIKLRKLALIPVGLTGFASLALLIAIQLVPHSLLSTATLSALYALILFQLVSLLTFLYASRILSKCFGLAAIPQCLAAIVGLVLALELHQDFLTLGKLVSSFLILASLLACLGFWRSWKRHLLKID